MNETYETYEKLRKRVYEIILPDQISEIIDIPLSLQDILRTFSSLGVPDTELAVLGAPGLCGLLITSKKAKIFLHIHKTMKEQEKETLQALLDLIN